MNEYDTYNVHHTYTISDDEQHSEAIIRSVAVLTDQDPRFMRPAEVDHLIGDSAKARKQLGWEPDVDFEGLVQMMVEAHLERWRAVKG